jgi:uncharacterized protein (TIGR02268 family)
MLGRMPFFPSHNGATAVLKPVLCLLLLVSLPGRADPVLPVTPGGCGSELRNMELEVGTPAMWICIAPEVATYLRFDTPILVDRVMLEGDKVSMLPSSTGIMLEGTQELRVGERSHLTVFFADGREPANATFVLVGHGVGKPRQVNVLRRPRTAASLRQEAEEQRQRAEACEQQLASHGAASTSSGLLERLLGLGHLYGLTLQWRAVRQFTSTGDNIVIDNIWTTRVEVGGGQREAAVHLRLRIRGTEAWKLEEASLSSAEGPPLMLVRVLPGAPVPSDGYGEVHVAVGPTDQPLTGTYTLKLWGAGREALIDNIHFR